MQSYLNSNQQNHQNFNINQSTLPTQLRYQLFTYIQKNEFHNFTELCETYKISPIEEISKTGPKWTSLHYAINFKRPNILLYILKRVYKYYPQNYKEIINFKTKEGWGSVSLCAIYDSVECLNMIINVGGGVDLYQKDSEGRDPFFLAAYYGNIDVYETLINIKKSKRNLAEINVDMLVDNEVTFENLFSKIEIGKPDPKMHPYSLMGIKKPCMFCKVNTGLLEYTTCCQIPVHLICGEDYKVEIQYNNEQKLEIKCPNCESVQFDTNPKIIDLQKAFEPPKQDNFIKIQ